MRLPIEVQAVIFCLNPKIEFLILHRTPELGNFWQNLSGGVEKGETLLQTLKRELEEETGISSKQIKQITENIYQYEWLKVNGEMKGKKIKEYVFAVEVDPDAEVKLSEEHDEYKWCDAEEAKSLIKWEKNKIVIDKTLRTISR